MKHIVRPAVLIVAAMAGSAVLLLVLVSATKNLSLFAAVPADFLPATHTKLLLHTPSPDTIKRWENVISTTWHEGDRVAAAYLQTDDAQGTVTFTDNTSSSAQRIGKYDVHTSDPLLLPEVTAQATSVQTSEPYQTLQRRLPANTSWSYISTMLIRTPATLGTRALQAALVGKHNWLAHIPENEPRIATRVTQRPTQSAPPVIPQAKERIFAISYANAANAWQYWQNAMTKADAAVIESLLRKQTEKLGRSASFEYDLLALMSEPGTLQLVASGATTHLLLSGSQPNETLLHQHVEQLRSSYVATLPTTRVTHRTLDQRFSTTDLRHDEDAIISTEERVGEYWVSGTRHADEQNGLFTAIKGTTFLLSTNEQVLHDALRASEPLSETPHTGILTTELWVDLPAISDLLQNTLPKEAAWLRNFGTGALLFSSEWQADVQSRTIRLPQNANQLLDSLL